MMPWAESQADIRSGNNRIRVILFIFPPCGKTFNNSFEGISHVSLFYFLDRSVEQLDRALGIGDDVVVVEFDRKMGDVLSIPLNFNDIR